MPQKDKEIIPHYRWFRHWETDSRSYAALHETIQPQEARRTHYGHTKFGWAQGKGKPYVSALTFYSSDGSTQEIQPHAYGYTPEPR